MDIQTATLRNGSEEARPAVDMLMGTLLEINNTLPGVLAFYDLVMRCRDKEHPIADAQLDTLRNLGLVGAGEWIHETTRNVVLSAVVGDGTAMKLVNPYQEEA